MSEGTCRCRLCGETKPLDRFYRNRTLAAGREAKCKDCMKLRRRELLAAKRSVVELPFKCAVCPSTFANRKALGQHHVQIHPDVPYQSSVGDPEYRRVWRLGNKYGITADEYTRMVAAQGGGCAICGATECDDGRRLHVDHCHETGKVRGLLCAACNHGLGKFRDSPLLLRRAVEYLEK